MGIGIEDKLFKFAHYAVVTLFLWTLFNLHTFLTILSVWNTLYIHFDWCWGLFIITTSWFERLDWWTIYDRVLLIWNKHDFLKFYFVLLCYMFIGTLIANLLLFKVKFHWECVNFISVLGLNSGNVLSLFRISFPCFHTTPRISFPGTPHFAKHVYPQLSYHTSGMIIIDSFLLCFGAELFILVLMMLTHLCQLQGLSCQ